MTTIRPALENELEQVYDVFYQNEMRDTPNPPAPMPASSTSYRHILQTGTLVVAEEEGVIVAYAGAITRGTITFLTDLFVHPDHQSGQLGKTLLGTVLPQDGLTHFTVSSSDPRAQALYIRAGMLPKWPCFALRLEQSARKWAITPTLEIVEADPADPALIAWDSQISGRERPDDHAYWRQEQRAVPLWFQRGSQRVGYGYIRLGAGNIWRPHACKLGPIGVISAEDAVDCLVAAVHWAAQRAEVLHLDLPGPHPGLPVLLGQGFLISYVDTFVSTTDTPFFDARCYIPSDGDLF
jgi:GNAT superfamily N-acetyltransferase